MAYLAPAGTPYGPYLSNGKAGEVVVEHEVLLVLAQEGVYSLFVAVASKGGGAESLGLTLVKRAEPWVLGRTPTSQ